MSRECCVCGRREGGGFWRRDWDMGEELRVRHDSRPVCSREFMDRLALLFRDRGPKSFRFRQQRRVEVQA